MTPSNKAAILTEARAHPMEVEMVDYPTAGTDEVIVKVSAIAINPMDHAIQTLGLNLFPWLQYPYIGGTDVAGTVVEAGSKVTSTKVGDRVLGLAVSFVPREGAFQAYVVLKSNLVSVLPPTLPFADAAVLPLGLATAAGGLYEPGSLELPYPTTTNPNPTSQTVVVWGGATSVGSNAIQLAVASGCDVFATCSPRNFAYCTALGASRTFDYRSPTLGADLLGALRGRRCGGGFAVIPGPLYSVFEVIGKNDGAKIVSVATPVKPENVPAGIRCHHIFGGNIKDNDVAAAVFNEFLAEALAAGRFKCMPPPEVVGEGLESLQGALDKLKKEGVSAKKLVVTI